MRKMRPSFVKRRFPGVHVGVHEAVEEHHLGDAAKTRDRDGRAIFGDVGGADAVDELHGQHAPSREIVEEPGAADARIAGEVLGDAAVVRSLEHEIELARERVSEAFDGADDAEEAHAWDELDDAGEQAQEREIAIDLRRRLAALDLDGDDGPVVEHAAVHLRDRGRGDGRFLDRAKSRARLGR